MIYLQRELVILLSIIKIFRVKKCGLKVQEQCVPIQEASLKSSLRLGSVSSPSWGMRTAGSPKSNQHSDRPEAKS
jgi:hypothetical protein